MTKAERARAVIESLDPLAVGEEVWFVYYDPIPNKQVQRRGVVKGFSPSGALVYIATGPERPTMPTYTVHTDDIVRDK